MSQVGHKRRINEARKYLLCDDNGDFDQADRVMMTDKSLV